MESNDGGSECKGAGFGSVRSGSSVFATAPFTERAFYFDIQPRRGPSDVSGRPHCITQLACYGTVLVAYYEYSTLVSQPIDRDRTDYITSTVSHTAGMFGTVLVAYHEVLRRVTNSLSRFVHSLSRFHSLLRFVHSLSCFVHSLSHFIHSILRFVHSLLRFVNSLLQLTFVAPWRSTDWRVRHPITFALRQVPLLVLTRRVATGRR